MREVANLVQSGHDSVIISSGSIEQHGPHLPLDTDYVLAKELAKRSAKRLRATLVAPVVPIGCAEHHMDFPGTVSVPKDVFVPYMENVATSLIRHGFRRLLFASFHGGNFAPSLEAARRIQDANHSVDVRTALDLGKLFGVTNGVIREFFPDRTALDCHAGCVETSMMLYLAQEYVREAAIEDGAIFSEFPPSFDNISLKE
jgi:creatinine amidohydrolase